MKKQLLLTLFLAGGMCFVGTQAWADPQQAEQQSSSVLTGMVVDENGEPAVGASVVVKSNKKIGTAVDLDGKFSINAAPGTKLTVSYVGYKSVDVDARAGMVVKLERNDAYLDEVVVVGYGTQKKVNLTGAVSTVDVQKQLESRPQQDLAKALQGAVPGLTVTTTNGGINSTATMRIRGLGTLSNSATSSPLIVVDGVPMDNMSLLNPDDIQDISVLKDAASSSIYGTRAAFGVILITTKKAEKNSRVTVKYSNNFSFSQATKVPQNTNVPEQIRMTLQSCYRTGDPHTSEFGVDLDKTLEYAEAWYEQNNGKPSGYREMRLFQSWDDVGDYYVDPVTNEVYYYADWDIGGIFYKDAAPSNTHNISVDGGADKVSYHVSFGYNGRNGLLNYDTDNLQRYNAEANIQVDVTNWLTVGGNLNYVHKLRNYCNPEGRQRYRFMWRWGSYFEPLGYVCDENGTPYDLVNDISFLKQAGPDITTYDKVRAQAWIRANITKDITLNADFTYDVLTENNKYSRNTYLQWYSWTTTWPEAPSYEYTSTNYARQWWDSDRKWNTNIYFTFDKSFNKAHNLKVILGFNLERETYNYLYASRNGIIDKDLPEIELATGAMDMSSSATHRATAGFFGRINYDYKGIYLFEVNGRFDGSSRFPANDQWAFFPSMSVGYRFSEENYWKNLHDVVNNAKLRFSYGSIGNEAIGSNRFISTISTTTAYWLANGGSDAISMFGMPTLVSESLSWERIQTLDLGLDLGFLNNSLTFTGDIFQRDTKDMLAPAATLPASVGASAAYQNTGSLRSRGFEIGLNWNHRFGDWTVFASATFGDAKSVVTEYNNETKLLSDNWTGKVYGDIYGFVTDRYFEKDDFYWHNDPETGEFIVDGYKEGIADQSALESRGFHYGPGDIKFKDLNGDGVIDGGTGTADDHGDLTVIGNNQPRYEYTFRVGATWKGFDIDAYFQGVGKRSVWTVSSFVIPQAQFRVSYYDGKSYNKVIVNDAGYIVDYDIDQNNFYPCPYEGAFHDGTVASLDNGCFNFYQQSRYLQDLSYLRFKTLTVGYTIPANITRKFLVENLRVYFTAENLFMLHDGSRDYPIDPEIYEGAQDNWNGEATFGRVNPMMRSYSFGIQLTF